jgi:putative tryptophan/tyrosine transport system substrate-binding protein
MKRRTFITLIGGAAASVSTALAQQPAKMKRIAMVHPAEPVANLVASNNPVYQAFFDELGRAGFVEGKNLIVERYSAEGNPDRYAQLARDVVDTRPDVIYPISTFLGVAFKTATTTIPIVVPALDPVAVGLVSNIARPGGNITGTALSAGLEIWGKRIGFLKEALPKLSNLCILMVARKEWEGPYGGAIRQAAKAASVDLNAVWFDGKIDAAAYQRVFAAFEQNRPDGLLVADNSIHISNGGTIIELAAKHRLPAMYTLKGWVEFGGLMAYSSDDVELFRSCAHQIGQILKGTNPGDIPFDQLARFTLALNLKTARALGLEFPATLLGIADLVVE